MNLCTVCGKKVPKKRLKEGPSEYSGFFCSTTCHLSRSDQMFKMMRETELEVEDELKRETGTLGQDGESWVGDALDMLDQAATSATRDAERLTPEEIAARFLGSFSVKFGVKAVSHLYGNIAEAVKGWTQKRAERRAEEARARQAEEARARQAAGHTSGRTPPFGAPTKTNGRASGQATTNGQTPTNGQAPGPQKNGAAPTGERQQRLWRKIQEPEDLEERPLEEQREWLLRRFYLPPTATREQLDKCWKAVAKKLHPDSKTGDPKKMAIANATRQRIIQIDEQLAPPPTPAPKKKRK